MRARVLLAYAMLGFAAAACAAPAARVGKDAEVRGKLAPEDMAWLSKAKRDAAKAERDAKELAEVAAKSKPDFEARVARARSSQAALMKLRERMAQSRAAPEEVELVDRGIAHAETYALNMELMAKSLRRQVELTQAAADGGKSLVEQFDKLKHAAQESAKLPLSDLPRYERDAQQAQANVNANAGALKAAEAKIENAEAKTANAEATYRKSREGMADLQAVFAEEKRKSEDWKRKYLLGALKLPVKVVKAPLDMIDSVGEETPRTAKLTSENLLLLKHCRVDHDESAWGLAAQQIEEAKAAQRLAALKVDRARMQMRIAQATAAALKARAAEAERERKRAAEAEAIKQAELKKAQAMEEEAALDVKRDRAEQRRQKLIAAKQAAGYGEQILLQMQVHVEDEKVALYNIQMDEVNVEKVAKEDEAAFRGLDHRLDVMANAKKAADELVDDQRRLELEWSQAVQEQEATKGLKVGAERKLAGVRDRQRKLAALVVSSTAGEPSPADVDMAQLDTDEQRQQYRQLLATRRKLVAEQLGCAQRIVDLFDKRLEVARLRIEAIQRVQKRLTERRSEVLWKREEAGISMTAVKRAWAGMQAGYGKAMEAAKNYQEVYDAWVVRVGKKRLMHNGLIALGAVVAALAIRWLLRRLLKKWRRSLRAKHHGRFAGRVRLAPPYMVSRNVSVLLFCGLVAAGAGWLKDNSALRATVLDVAMMLGVFRLLHSLSSAAFSPHREDRRLCLWDESLCRHLHRVIGLVLFASILAWLIAQGLRHYQTDKEAAGELIALCWSLYKLTLVVIGIVFISHPFFISKIMPQAATWAGKFVRSSLTVLYPLAACFVVGILAVWLAGYRVMAKEMARTLVANVLIIVAGYAASRVVARHVRRRYARRKPQAEEAASAFTWGHALTLAMAAAVVCAVAAVWRWRFEAALKSEAAPGVVRAGFAHVQGALAGSVNWVRTAQIPLGDAAPTSPLKILAGLTVALIGLFVATLVRKAVDRAFFSDPTRRAGAWHTIRACVYYVAVGLICAYGVTVAGVPLSALTVFAGAFGIGIGFGMQNIISNFISGIIILFERPIRIQDFIDVDANLSGWVRHIGTRSTVIETRDRVNVIVPNSKFIESSVVNWHGRDPRTRVHVPVGVAYGSDVPTVKDSLLTVAKAGQDVLDYPTPEVWFMGFGDSSLDFELLVWVRDPATIPVVTSNLNYAIDAVFRERGVEIPFPQRDLHVRSSIPLPHTPMRPNGGEGGDGE